MESQTANQLPEANTLPDGFVDSSAEDLALLTPNVEQEKPHGDYKEGFAGLGDSSESRHEFASKEFQTSEGRTEKTQKLRTFPVPLSEMDNSDASVDLAEVPSKGSVEQRESAVINPNSAAVSEASAGASGCCKVKGQVQEECQNIESSTEERSEAQGIIKKDVSVSESDDTLKNRKPENTETRRKSSKRTFKSEKEFLEFTLKYQQVLAERDAAMAVRDKLESLCRELQRQNKMLMDECKRVSSEGQNLRLDLSAKFQDAIKDVSIKLEEQKDDCLSQLKENEMLRTNLKQLADQYALTEQQYAQKLKQKTLELQIAELKIKQHEEKLVQEQSQMKLYAEQVSQLLATEKNLRLQLTADGEKFQQFQDALVKSNEVFETFKQEIEKMAKSIKELKKENAFLKSKCEKSDFTLIELVEERERMKKQLEKSKNQKEKLESLCRSLQAERKQNSVGSNNSDSAPE
ncbi:alpha-taxilin-like protein [Citrus sinensis]|uniref:Alpha-taxilin-like protein n=2 Tax=Citrus TaxID=2706 RepID=A0ACB8L4H4_CITSI|nr:alpha-taxilin-like protein [Citrus sinensis]